MAIPTLFDAQFESKLSKGTSKTLYNALKYTCLDQGLVMQWQELTNKRRLILEATWSNIQRTIDVLDILPEISEEKLSTQALSNLRKELQEAQESAPIHTNQSTNCNCRGGSNYRRSYTPQEYQQQKEAFQFVLNQFGHEYDWRQVPHIFYYKLNCKVRCWYRRVMGTSHNGGHYYEMHICPKGAYHSGRWYTYGRNSLGWKAQGIKADQEFLHNIYLVHEITHAVENYRSKRTNKKYTSGEMNTTLHELWYAREHYPQYFRKLSPVQDGRRNEWWSPVPPLEGQNPREQFRKHRKAAAPKG